MLGLVGLKRCMEMTIRLAFEVCFPPRFAALSRMVACRSRQRRGCSSLPKMPDFNTGWYQRARRCAHHSTRTQSPEAEPARLSTLKNTSAGVTVDGANRRRIVVLSDCVNYDLLRMTQTEWCIIPE